MKIRMFRFYRTGCTVFAILGILVIAGSLIFTKYGYSGAGTDDFIMLLIGLPLGVLIAAFPFLLNHRQLTSVVLESSRCTSYTLFRKKLCQVDFREEVYSRCFDVRFPYSPPVPFIAVSNAPFDLPENGKNKGPDRFFGEYDRTKIIVFPLEDIGGEPGSNSLPWIE